MLMFCNIMMDINPNKMKNACPFYSVFQVLKVFLNKNLPPDLLFLVVLYQPLHQQISLFTKFLEDFQNFHKIFATNFPFLMDSINPPPWCSLYLLFLLVFIKFYISRYHFSQEFQNFIKHLKKIFSSQIFLKHTHTHPYQPKSAKHDKSFLAMLPNVSWFFKIIML